MVVLRVLLFLVGAAVVFLTLGAAIRTVVLPRGVPSRLARVVFLTMRRLFGLRAGRRASYERRDAVMALYGPTSLFALLLAWVILVLGGFVAMYFALGGGRSLREAFVISGSAIFTLGFDRPADLPSTALAFTEAALGLVLLALLITYLPSLYGAFSRRETAVTALEVRAGSPPWGVEMLQRFFVLQRPEKLSEVWTRWEDWFVELEETHTSFPALSFFRSPQPDHSWITASGAVLDAAALMVSTVDYPHDVQADICIRAGYLALRRVAAFFRIAFDDDPAFPDHPISVTREEFDVACEQLAAAGVPLKPRREEAWRDFAGWRVNYDDVLIALAGLTMAPVAPWSSDRRGHDAEPALAQQTARTIPR